MPTPLEILLVEDDPAQAKVLIQHIQRHNARFLVTHLTDAATAIDRLDKGPLPALVITDIGLKGPEVMDSSGQDIALVAIHYDVPVIEITGQSGPLLQRSAYLRGSIDFLFKPLDISALLSKITTVLKLAGKLREVIHFPNGYILDILTGTLVSPSGTASYLGEVQARVFSMLAVRLGVPMEARAMAKSVYGASGHNETDTLHTTISRLRRFLERNSLPFELVTMGGTRRMASAYILRIQEPT
jgi:DNA-binding response OmpR family regulator